MSIPVPTTIQSTTRPTIHYKILGRTRFRCIEPECDGKHHVYCSCGH